MAANPVNTTNRNTRALVSALRSDYKDLRRAAAAIIDTAIDGKKSARFAVMVAFEASPPTATTLLRERAKVTKGGARKRVSKGES